MNRGFAALGDKLFKVNLESKLVALDPKTGNELWQTEIDHIKKGYSATVAPLAAKNMVVTGIAGAEFDVRGFIDAYYADTGKRAWRLWTVAGEGEPGGNTWAGDFWKRGGGGERAENISGDFGCLAPDLGQEPGALRPGSQHCGSVAQQAAYEIPFGIKGPFGILLGLRRYTHNGIVQPQDLQLIKIDRPRILANITGAVDATRKLLELFRLDSSQTPYVDLRRRSDLL